MLADADAGTDVVLWARRDELAAAVNNTHENPDYLPGIRLPHNLSATADACAAVEGADFVVLAVPSQSLRENLADRGRRDRAGRSLLVSLMKGVELGTTKRMSEVICEVADVPSSGSPSSPAPTWPRRSPAASRRPSVVACTDAAARSACRTPA